MLVPAASRTLLLPLDVRHVHGGGGLGVLSLPPSAQPPTESECCQLGELLERVVDVGDVGLCAWEENRIQWLFARANRKTT